MKLKDLGISSTSEGLVFNVNELANNNDDSAKVLKKEFTGNDKHCILKVSDQMKSYFANGEVIIGISTVSSDNDRQEFLYKLCDYIHENGVSIERIVYNTNCDFVLECFKLGEDGYIETTGDEDDFIYMNQKAYDILADIDL